VEEKWIKVKNLPDQFIKRYMLRPVARCRAGCRVHDAGGKIQNKGDRRQNPE